MWLDLRGPTTQFCCSLSRVVVSPGPFSGPAEGEDRWDLEERLEDKVGWGLEAHVAVLKEDGGVCERGVWLLGGGVAWGKDWLGRRLEEEEEVVLVWGRAVRLLGGVG